MRSKTFGGVTFTLENPFLKADNGKNAILMSLNEDDRDALVNYTPNPDPELFDCHVVNGVKEPDGTFKNLVLWTDKKRQVYITVIDHQTNRESIWVETDPINFGEFRHWLA